MLSATRKLAAFALMGTMLMVPYGGDCDSGYGYSDLLGYGSVGDLFDFGYGSGGGGYYTGDYYADDYYYEDVYYDDGYYYNDCYCYDDYGWWY